MSRHTPGPWRVKNYQTAVLVDATRDGKTMLIALVADNDTQGDTKTERKMNNARLIAAAPQMLEALEKIAEIGRQRGDARPQDAVSCFLIAEAAIKAAKGEA